MNEAAFWDKVRSAFKRRQVGTAWKVQDAYRSGLPDADVIVEGHVAKLELKYANAWPPRGGALKTVLKMAQRRHLIEWQQAGGNAFVLLGVGKSFYVIDPSNAAWTDGSKFREDEVKSICLFSSDNLSDLVDWVARSCPGWPEKHKRFTESALFPSE